MAAEDTGGDTTPDATQAMYRPGTDGIVDPDFFRNPPPNTTNTPPINPIIIASLLVTESQLAVIATRPASTPLSNIDKLTLWECSCKLEVIIAATPPAAGASVILTAINMVAAILASPENASWLPGLKPYQPIQSMNTPEAASARLCQDK